MFKALMSSAKHEPSHPQKFYCKHCDMNTVDSEKPDTGDFFVIFGHAWSQQQKEYDGAYTGVMFAVCKVCQER